MKNENIENIMPTIGSYWAGWSNKPIPDNFNSLYPSFAMMRKSGPGRFYTSYEESGNFHKPSDRGPYKTWNDWARHNFERGGRAKVAYGGGTNEEFRKYVIEANEQELDILAGEIKANIKNAYFGGVDLDIEGWWLHNKEENLKFAVNLAKIVKILRKSLDEDPATKGAAIDIAVGYDAAGKVEGGAPDGSYTGTMLPFFRDAEAMRAVGKINIMSYGAVFDRREVVTSLLNTFSKEVPPEKFCFGIEPHRGNEQPMSPQFVEELSRFLKGKCAGSFLWAIGSMGNLDPEPYIRAMQRGFGVALAPQEKAVLAHMRQTAASKAKALNNPQFFSGTKNKAEIIAYASLVNTILKLEKGETISKEESEKLLAFQSELGKDLPEKLALVQTYVEVTVKSLQKAKADKKEILTYVGIVDTILKMRENKNGVSDEEYKQLSNVWEEFEKKFAALSETHVESPIEKNAIIMKK